MLFAPVLALMMGCTEGPLFTDIQGIEVQVVSPNGLKRTPLEQTGLREGIACLGSTGPSTPEDSQKRQLVQTAYLVLVTDAKGTHNFEMITDQHMKGNKNKYYENKCILDIMKKYGPKT